MKKEKVLEILHSHSYNVEDQSGNHLIVVDDDSWDAVATEVENCFTPDEGQSFSINDISKDLDSKRREAVLTGGIRVDMISVAEMERVMKKYGMNYEKPF